ncbi:dienelactone hydrolase family protein [Amphritea sp. HPY]|uniref:dienelactone hydrolase family protein n=1 Tax=Amphritea sp. HPY TaxID=3421652 RepID=UPI003D7EC9C5
MPSFRFESQRATPTALVIMFHGVGSSPKSLQPLATYLYQQCDDLAISIPTGFSKSPLNPKGFHWFGIADISEENRQARIDAVMPAFDQLIRREAESFGVPLDKVVLLGFSQGTIMSLEWFKQSRDRVAGIIAIAGRFAELPEQQPLCDIPVCLIHGEQDEVSDPVHAQQSYNALLKMGVSAELNLIADAPHRLTPDMESLMYDFIQRVAIN